MVLSGLLMVYAPAWILLETSFRGDAPVERLFCRYGVCDTDAVLAAQTLAHNGSVPDVPSAELLEALRRDAASPHRWCDLGEAMSKTGNIEEARFCFSAALALGTNVPPVLLRAANFYYGFGETQRALELNARVLEKTATYDSGIFRWCEEKKIGVREVLRYGLPAGERASQAYLRYLIDNGNFDDAATVWVWLLSHGYADDRLANEYVNFLFTDQRYESAARSWALYLGDHRNGYLESNWLFNGDFETAPSGSALDWKMENLNNDVQVALDRSVSYTGGQSLRIRFGGKENVNYNSTYQTAFVPPGTYRFEAYIRTQQITTDQGIGFHIFDPQAASRVDIKTEQTVGTNAWKRVEKTIHVPPDTMLLVIQVARQPSLKFDNQISGTAWIDSMKLLKLSGIK